MENVQIVNTFYINSKSGNRVLYGMTSWCGCYKNMTNYKVEVRIHYSENNMEQVARPIVIFPGDEHYVRGGSGMFSDPTFVKAIFTIYDGDKSKNIEIMGNPGDVCIVEIQPNIPFELAHLLTQNIDMLKKWLNYNINIVTPFDVTLRDGLQTLKDDDLPIYTFQKKKEIYHEICNKYLPIDIEIGSLANSKFFQIFSDTPELFLHVENYKNSNDCMSKKNNFILVPSIKYFIKALRMGLKNFSFITSVSDSFQYKNTKMTVEESYNNIKEMINYIDDTYNINLYKFKIYVSCINKCPISGTIDKNAIVSYIDKLQEFKNTTICLSDTCGTLTNEEFKYILDNIKCVSPGYLPYSNISLHLHIHENDEAEAEAEKIMHTALDYGIKSYDVSNIKSGGCSITMNKNEIAPNMSYEQYYKFLINYLKK